MKESLKKISINELYDLIKLYKQATVDGRKTELIISYPFENGTYDYSRRVITFGISGGFSRDRDSFIVDSADFDKYILQNIVEYYSYDDSLLPFDKTYVPNFNVYKGVSETLSGNVLYIEDKEDKFDLFIKERRLEKPLFTNTDKVWEEILNYTMERKKIQNIYRCANFTHSEIGKICNFVIKLSEDKKINIGNKRKSRENNINYVTELFKDKEKILLLGLSEEIYQKIVDTETIRQVAELVGCEKRLESKVDRDSSIINDKVRFAIDELDKVDYFNIKNASIKSFKSGDFLTSKPLALVKLKHIEEEEEKDNYERFLNYQKYCDEILLLLERNAKRNEKDRISKIEKNIELESYNTTIVDSYDELWDAVSLVVGARVNNEKYEIVVEDNQENGNIIVRVSLVSSIVKTDTFIFEFTDKLKLKEELEKIKESIKKIDSKEEVAIKYLGNSEVALNINSIKNNKLSNNLLNNDINEVIDKNNIEKDNKNDIINKLIKIKSQDIESNKEIIGKKSIKNLGNINIPNNNEKMILNSSDNLNVNTIKENKIDVEKNKEIKIEDLEKIEKFFSDYMLEKESKKELVEIPFMNLSISTYELLINKYKEKLDEMYINNLLPKDEKEVIDNIKSLKSKLEIYYNETVGRSASLIEEEIKRLASCEVALASIYQLEMIYNNKKDLKNDTPSNILKSKVYQKEYNENDTYIDKLTEEYINKYRAILHKYDDNKKYDEKDLIGDKDTLLQVITYKMKLKDVYDSIISKENLSQEDLSLLAKYERILYEIYSVDVKYQDNIENKIKELKNQEKFLTPSSKIYLSSLEKEFNNDKDNKKENDYLFEIITKNDVKENKNDEKEIIKKSYYEALTKSNKNSPLNIRIDYSNNKEEAKLIIYNFGDNENEYAYQKTLSSEEIKNLIPLLCELFNENKLDFVFKYNIASSDNMCLLGFTQDKKTFKIVNAAEELIDYAKDELEGKIKKEEGMKK